MPRAMAFPWPDVGSCAPLARRQDRYRGMSRYDLNPLACAVQPQRRRKTCHNDKERRLSSDCPLAGLERICEVAGTGDMRTIGIDLALTTAHKAVIADAQGHFLSPVFSFHTTPVDLERVLARAQDSAPNIPLQVVMAPTGMAWFPIAVFFARRGAPIFLVNS